MAAGMTLDEWKSIRGIDDKTIADLVRRTQASISRLRCGKRFPSAELQRHFFEITDGLVTPNDWVGCGYRLPVPKTKAAAE
jgi:transcriptional regulator with XRE-family HTH domain